MVAHTREIFDFREVLMRLVVREIKSRTRKALLSYGWVVIEAILATGVFTWLMHEVLGLSASDKPYPIFVYSGLLFWQWFASTLPASTGSLLTYKGLVQQVYFPREYLVLAPVMEKLVNFGVGVAVLAAMMALYGVAPHFEMLWVIPVMMLAQMVVMVGLGFLLAPLNLAFRDIGNMLTMILPLLLFVTPVVFAGDQVPEQFQFLNTVNPMALIIEASRSALLDGIAPQAGDFALVFGISFGVLAVGYATFRAVEPIFADII